jgi:hypothetical protein
MTNGRECQKNTRTRIYEKVANDELIAYMITPQELHPMPVSKHCQQRMQK